MKKVKTTEAVGQMLCHDITRIIPGVEKGPVFRKGHVITPEDIPLLLSVGKENIYIWENDETMLHENEAAEVLYDLCGGRHMHPSDIKEGKVELIADKDGLLKIDRQKLLAINSLGDMMIASRHGDFPIKKGDVLAGTRVIPLVIKKERMELAKEAAPGGNIFTILPFRHKNVAIITTGSEVFHKRIEDGFTPVLKRRLAEYDTSVIYHEVCDDDPEGITAAIQRALEAGAELVLCTGGMSVDPDDRTPLAIRNTGTRIVSYGAPVLPGAMLLVSYYGETNIPIVGLPGCVMYSKRTIFDLVLPRLLADDLLEKADLERLGEGGLCLNCDHCTFPNCGFGK